MVRENPLYIHLKQDPSFWIVKLLAQVDMRSSSSSSSKSQSLIISSTCSFFLVASEIINTTLRYLSLSLYIFAQRDINIHTNKNAYTYLLRPVTGVSGLFVWISHAHKLWVIVLLLETTGDCTCVIDAGGAVCGGPWTRPHTYIHTFMAADRVEGEQILIPNKSLHNKSTAHSATFHQSITQSAFVCMCVCTRVNFSMCVYICIYIYIYICVCFPVFLGVNMAEHDNIYVLTFEA